MLALIELLRPILVPMIAETVAYFFHRRSVDPSFLAKSDEVFGKVATAKTKDEKANASKDLQNLFRS